MKFNSHRFYFWSVKKSKNPDIDVFSLIKLELRKIKKKSEKNLYRGTNEIFAENKPAIPKRDVLEI